MTERGFFDAFPSLARLSQQKREQVYAHFASAPGWLTEQLSIVEFPTDTIFIREGQPARDVYVVASGTVKAIEYRVLGVQYDFIGVDVDQAAITDPQYGEGMTVTSATKGLGPTVENTLKDVIENDNWAAYSGKSASLGLVSAESTENYVQLPMNSTHWCDTFTQAEHTADVAGSITISNDTNAMPETVVEVQVYTNIKG